MDNNFEILEFLDVGSKSIRTLEVLGVISIVVDPLTVSVNRRWISDNTVA